MHKSFRTHCVFAGLWTRPQAEMSDYRVPRGHHLQSQFTACWAQGCFSATQTHHQGRNRKQQGGPGKIACSTSGMSSKTIVRPFPHFRHVTGLGLPKLRGLEKFVWSRARLRLLNAYFLFNLLLFHFLDTLQRKHRNSLSVGNCWTDDLRRSSNICLNPKRVSVY